MAEYPLRYSAQALKYLSDHANVPGTNAFNPCLLEQGYVPQTDDGSGANVLAAFTNLYAARTNRNALIGPVD